MISRFDNRAEVSDASGQLPEPPAWLTSEAKERFCEVAALLDRAGTLAATDAGVLARYAATYCRWAAAEQAMAESGEAVHYVRLTDRNGLPASSVATPAQMAASKAHDQIIVLERELGLTPRARALAKTPSRQPADDPMREWFSDAGI